MTSATASSSLLCFRGRILHENHRYGTCPSGWGSRRTQFVEREEPQNIIAGVPAGAAARAGDLALTQAWEVIEHVLLGRDGDRRCEWRAESANSPKLRVPCRQWTEPGSESQSFWTILPLLVDGDFNHDVALKAIQFRRRRRPGRERRRAARDGLLRRSTARQGPYPGASPRRAPARSVRAEWSRCPLRVLDVGSSRLPDFFILARCLQVRRVLNCCCVAASEVPGEASLTAWVL